MKVHFRLAWWAGPLKRGAFKNSPYFDLFSDYSSRISRFASCSASGLDLKKEKPEKAIFWFCHPSRTSKQFTSQGLADQLQKVRISGAKELQIVIGPPDGFKNEIIDSWKPDLLWSFGLLTLPHELALVVASEQLYRAFAILNHLPYHQEHSGG